MQKPVSYASIYAYTGPENQLAQDAHECGRIALPEVLGRLLPEKSARFPEFPRLAHEEATTNSAADGLAE
jgi:hypothetical protein